VPIPSGPTQWRPPEIVLGFEILPHFQSHKYRLCSTYNKPL